MSISPPPFSPPRFQSNEEDNNDYVNVDDDEYIDSPRTLISSFDLYKNAIDRLRSSVTCQSIEQQQNSLEDFKPLSTRTNAWLYMRIHDDLFSILLDYLLIENLLMQSTVLSIFANIACEQASHEQVRKNLIRKKNIYLEYFRIFHLRSKPAIYHLVYLSFLFVVFLV